jgi:hypothetical protein
MLSDAEPATGIDAFEVVAGAEVIVIAGGAESMLRQKKRSDSSNTRSSEPSVAGSSVAGISVAEAAVSVESSLAPPQPARIIEAMA